MSLKFNHETLGQRVLFGAGEAANNLESEVERLSAKRINALARRE